MCEEVKCADHQAKRNPHDLSASFHYKVIYTELNKCLLNFKRLEALKYDPSLASSQLLDLYYQIDYKVELDSVYGYYTMIKTSFSNFTSLTYDLETLKTI